MKRMVLMLLVIVLTACGNTARQYMAQETAAQARYKAVGMELQAGLDVIKKCHDELFATEQGKIVKPLFLSSPNDPQKVDLLTNNSEFTDSQKQAIREVYPMRSACRKKAFDVMLNVPIQFKTVILQNWARVDSIKIDILSGKIKTISEANTKILASYEISRKDYNLAHEEFLANLTRQHQAELSQRREDVARMQAEEARRQAAFQQALQNWQQQLQQRQQLNQQMQQTAPKQVDYNCLSQCLQARYMYGLCESKCSY